MLFDELPHCRDFLDDLHFDEPNDARMRETPHEDQLPEVLVFGNQHPLLLVGERKQGFIRGAWS